MSLLQRGLMFVLAAGTLAIPSSVPPETRAGGRAAVTVDPQTVSVYTPADKEYYLTESQMDFIRPGLKVTIGTVTDMAPGKKPSVELTMTDDLNQPLDRLGGTTPGVVTLRFIPAVWDAALGYYDDLINSSNGNPTRDNTGDVGRPRRRQVQVHVRDDDADLRREQADDARVHRQPEHDRLPREDLLRERLQGLRPGDRRRGDDVGRHDDREVQPATTRSSATAATTARRRPAPSATTRTTWWASLQEFDMGIWHRIHSSNLEDVGEITYPQYYLNNCEACHDPKQPQGTVYLTKPGRQLVRRLPRRHRLRRGRGPPAPRPTTAQCANCHIPDSGQEFDASIKGAHTLPLESKQLKGLKAEIVSVTNTAPGQKPIVTFKLTEKRRQRPRPEAVRLERQRPRRRPDDRLRHLAEHPRERLRRDLQRHDRRLHDDVDGPGRPSRARSPSPWTSAASVTVNGVTFNEGAFNPIYNVAATGTVVARRTVVNQAKCLAVPRLAPAPRRAAARGRRVPPLPHPERRRQLAPTRPPTASPSRSRWPG